MKDKVRMKKRGEVKKKRKGGPVWLPRKGGRKTK